MVSKLKTILAIICIAAGLGAWPNSGRYNIYAGPCDIATCAEAYSVTRAMISSYHGPLFQLSNGSSTLDIGQSNHKADMTTWSAFCSGVASNCTYSKFYAQIHTTSNDLTPFNGGVNVMTFTIEAATGLPQLNDATNSPSTSHSYAVGGASDNASTGITAGGTAETVMEVGKSVANTGICCGNFGTAHKFNAGNTIGTDFMVMPVQGRGTFNHCRTNETFCFAIDEETDTDQEDYSGFVMDYVGIISWDGSTNVKASVNGVQLFNVAPTSGAGNMNSGTRIHLGGGGDMSASPIIAREMFIANSVLTSNQTTLIMNNVRKFYSALTFKFGPTNAPASYAGPADIVSGSVQWVGLRAYSAAIAAAGTQKIVNVKNQASTHTCDLLVATNGGLGNTANCSTPGDNGQSGQSFCFAGTTTTCTVEKIYDQSGGGNDYTPNSAGHAKLAFNCINFTPCVNTEANTLSVTTALAADSQPVTGSTVAARIGTFSANNPIMDWLSGSLDSFLLFTTSANTLGASNRNGGAFPILSASATDNVIHALQAVFNGASSNIFIDGTSTGGTLGTESLGVNGGLEFSANSFQQCDCYISEAGWWPSGFSGTQQTNMNANQHNYWGF